MKQYKYIAVDGTEIVFRLLSAEESDRAFQTLSEKDTFVDEFLFNLITANKYNPDDLLAGIISSVLFVALKISGTLRNRLDFPKQIDQSRKNVNENAYYILYAAIVKAQPSYNLEGLKQKTLSELIELYTFSEVVLGKQIIDTKQIYQLIEEETAVKPKRGIKSVTSEELDALKAALGNEEYGGRPPDEFSF